MNNALDVLQDFEKLLSKSGDIVIGLDFDGTLTPIVETPDNARLSGRMKSILDGLIGDTRYRTVIVTGRALNVIKEKLGNPAVACIGNHGFEIESPEYTRSFIDGAWSERLENICRDLETALSSIPGAAVERKGATASVHFRNVKDGMLAEVESVFQAVLKGYEGVTVTTGKKVFELRPPVEMNKGRAVIDYLSAVFGTGWKRSVSCVYIGDDTTDEDVFRVVDSVGAGIKVTGNMPAQGETAARYYLKDVDEVGSFIMWLTSRG